MDRARRLRKGRDFDDVYSKGTVVSGPLLVLRHRPNGLDTTRWGFAVGKRLAKRAVVRNRVRRRLKEAARQLSVRPGADVVVTARAPAIDARYATLDQALRRGLSRAGLLEGQETP